MKEALHDFLVLPSGSDPYASQKLQRIRTAKQWMHCDDSFEVYNAAAVDTGKLRIQSILSTGTNS